ncbi:hypothetical protein BM525_19950 (plasmid) [Alteromonas mediterranea]|uniref:Pilus assembly protein E-set like domain-containing protein n=1 Tax=Alteromonas mediterranea TaxID=314275 RepID=A0AAC9JFN5_9ALTE|nr:hypothetical protein BM524_19755 [Alteromonas mediterranea]APE00012.1 hypothetical protein BM525_19950 [Alteromonas mediterranea]
MLCLKNSFAFVLVGLSSMAWGEDAGVYKIPIPDGVPEGFEHLSQEGGYYDLYINGVYHSTITTSVILGELPNSLLSKKIGTHLNAPQWHHDHQRFIKRTDAIVGAFDGKRRVDVFFPKEENDVADPGFSWQANINTNQLWNPGGGSPVGVTQLIGLVSLNDKAVRLNAYHRDDSVALTTAAFTHEFGDSRMSYGLFSPTYGSYSRLYGQSIIGVQYHSAALSLESASKRPDIPLVLSDAAIVVVMRGQTTLKTVTLNAGEQSIPVHDLPPGHYEVTLQVQYFDGQAETLYASVDAPTRGDVGQGWQGLSVGRLYRGNDFNAYPEQHRDIFISTAYNVRLSESIAGDLNLNYNQGVSVNPSLNYRDGRLSSRLSLVIGEENEGFWDTAYQWGKHRISTRYQYREYDVAHVETGIDELIETSDSFIESYPYENLDTNFLTASYRYKTDRFGSFYTSLQYNFSRNKEYVMGMHVMPLYRNRAHNLVMRTTVRHGEETFIGVNLTYRLSPSGGDYTLNSALDITQDTAFRQTVYQQKEYKNWKINNRIGLISSSNSTSAHLHSSFNNNNYGYGSLGVTRIDNGLTQNTYVNGLASVKFTGDANSFHVVGREMSQTGMVIDLSKQDHDEEYTLEVNNQRRKYQGGESHFVPLAPHQKYSITLLNSDSRQQRVKRANKRVYMHRYNVYAPKWEVKTIEMLFGTLFVNGQLMPDAHLKNDISQGFSDKDGRFILETYDENINVNGKPCLIVDKTVQDVYVSCIEQHNEKEKR